MSDASELPLLVGAGRTAAESLLLIGVPDGHGVVHVRSWSAEDWSAPPVSRAERASVLLKRIEAAASEGRSLNQSLYTVRLWLRDEGSGTR